MRDLDRLDATVMVPVPPGVLADVRAELAVEVAEAEQTRRYVDVLAVEMSRRRARTLAHLRVVEAERARRALPGLRPRASLLPVGVRRSPPRPELSGGPSVAVRRGYDADPVRTPAEARARWVSGLAAQRRRDDAAERRRAREAARGGDE